MTAMKPNSTDNRWLAVVLMLALMTLLLWSFWLYGPCLLSGSPLAECVWNG